MWYQVTKWLSDISDKLSSTHGDIGTSKTAVEKLLKAHDKQAENAKVHYALYVREGLYKRIIFPLPSGHGLIEES